MSSSSDLAGLLMIIGLALAIISYRNYTSPPPQYRHSSLAGQLKIQFVWMILGIIVFTAGIVVAANSWFAVVFSVANGIGGGGS